MRGRVSPAADRGYAKAGYVRDGGFHEIAVNDQPEIRDLSRRGRAVVPFTPIDSTI